MESLRCDIWCESLWFEMKAQCQNTQYAMRDSETVFIYPQSQKCTYILFMCALYTFPLSYEYFDEILEHGWLSIYERDWTKKELTTKRSVGWRELKPERKQIDNANEYFLNHRKLIYSNWLHGRLGSNFLFRSEIYKEFGGVHGFVWVW